jgi:hypothetical protein
MDKRFDRNVRLFGGEGQDRLRNLTVAIIGVGGLGTHVVQQLALLGVGRFLLIDHETLDETNLNRYVAVYLTDVGQPKALLGARLIRLINPNATVEAIEAMLQSDAAFEAIRRADIVIGCLDTDGARLVCTEVAAAAGKPYLDLASDILTEGTLSYGGRMVFSFIGDGCLVCRNVLDMDAARFELDPTAAATHEAIYGVPRADLRQHAGPSVVSINGVVASLAVTELMLHVTGIRRARTELTYRGELGKVLASSDAARSDCYFCTGIFGRWDDADVKRCIIEVRPLTTKI